MIHWNKTYAYLKQNKLLVLLFCYHFLFIIYGYFLRVQRGMSDAHLYWGLKYDITKHDWFHYFKFGTNFMLFLNYPFVKIGIPFFVGFLIYGIIGFFGIVKWIRWTELVLGKNLRIYQINVLPILYFLPNLHAWTASLGKEALVFYGIASVFYGYAKKQFFTLNFVIGVLLLMLVRPHVALMLIFSFLIILLFNKKISTKRIILFTLISVFLGLGLFYVVLQITSIRYWDWQRIIYYNRYSVLSFKSSGSYVPMLEYNYLYKLFSFNFRPLFFDAHSVTMILSSFENLLTLLLFALGGYFCFKFYKKLLFPSWTKIVAIFSIISSVLFIERYANLGIFVRTKIMFQPFMLVVILFIILQSISFNQISKK